MSFLSLFSELKVATGGALYHIYMYTLTLDENESMYIEQMDLGKKVWNILGKRTGELLSLTVL